MFHLAQNAAAQAPNVSLRKELCQSVKHIYQSLDKTDAKTRLKTIVERYKNKASKFCDWLEEHFIESLTYYDFPSEHWRKIRTTNVVERMNEEQDLYLSSGKTNIQLPPEAHEITARCQKFAKIMADFLNNL